MLAGPALGPSLLGLVAPGTLAVLFPAGTTGALSHLSLIGLVLFMLTLGAEFDPDLVSGRKKAAFGITIASIALPLIGGVLLALPRDPQFRNALSAALSGLPAVLLPVYFAYTGLRAEVSLLQSAGAWLMMGLVLLVAVGGKFAGAALAARVGGLGWRESLSIGALLNTRGLMELVIANVGLDLGIISPTLFTMLVLMALLTTVLAAPALTLIERVGRGSMATGAAEAAR
jgi:Kef-type K+ transport system membrane component KefB